MWKKYCTAGQATNNNMGHAHCILDYLRLQVHTQNRLCLLRLHCKNGCRKAPHCYVKPTLPVLLIVMPCKVLIVMYYDTKFTVQIVHGLKIS
jgi:hypothetical protein